MLSYPIEMGLEDADLSEVDKRSYESHHGWSVPATATSEDVNEADNFKDEPCMAGPDGQALVLSHSSILGWCLVGRLILVCVLSHRWIWESLCRLVVLLSRLIGCWLMLKLVCILPKVLTNSSEYLSVV
jgi:hypothetical protein